jgi:hypothetical protein
MPVEPADLVAADSLSFAQLLSPHQLSELASIIADAREQGCTLGEEKGVRRYRDHVQAALDGWRQRYTSAFARAEVLAEAEYHAGLVAASRVVESARQVIDALVVLDDTGPQ